jgi:hypothetical protein
VVRPSLVDRNQLTLKVRVRCRKHGKLTCFGDGERLNAKSDEKNSASSRFLHQLFEEVGYVEWNSASQHAASC